MSDWESRWQVSTTYSWSPRLIDRIEIIIISSEDSSDLVT